MRRRVQIISDDGEIVSDQSIAYAAVLNDDGYRIPYNRLGARTFWSVKFPEEMNTSDIGRMTIISTLMVGKTNMLGYRCGRKIEAYTENELIDLVGLKARQGRQFIKKMYDLHILRRIETGIYVNPIYFMVTGQRLSLDLFLIFQEDMRGFLPEWVLCEFLRQASMKQEIKKDGGKDSEQEDEQRTEG